MMTEAHWTGNRIRPQGSGYHVLVTGISATIVTVGSARTRRAAVVADSDSIAGRPRAPGPRTDRTPARAVTSEPGVSIRCRDRVTAMNHPLAREPRLWRRLHSPSRRTASDDRLGDFRLPLQSRVAPSAHRSGGPRWPAAQERLVGKLPALSVRRGVVDRRGSSVLAADGRLG
jgi:hypothetical protein